MVWECMSAEGVGQLTVCQILEPSPISSCPFQLPTCSALNLQTEQCSVSHCQASKTWMNERGVQLLDWPTESPDMSPIENMWRIIKAAVSERKPRNMQTPC